MKIPLPLGIVLALVSAASAEPLDDRHLSTLPRTKAEAARIAAVLAPPADFSKPERFEDKPGGAATVRAMESADAFSQPSGNMSFEAQMGFKLGNALFRKAWIAAPSSTLASDGLGPLYNARACQDCHIKDGRGHRPEAGSSVSMFLRISVTGGTDPGIPGWHPTQDHPVYGGQIQDLAAPGLTPEGRMEITETALPVTLSDGTVVTLMQPSYHFAALMGDPGAVMLSPRVAPQMIGLGLLEAIPPADILAHADDEDADGDGISGRAQIVPSDTGAAMLGRFGLKAGAPTIKAQSAGAFSGDMGLSTPLHPAPWGDCTAAETACRSAPDGQDDGIRDGLEVDGPSLDLVTFYARNLGVPARRGVDDPLVLQGKQVFYATGCPACHVPKFVTARLQDQPEQSFQLIWPYTDLLLHDMGPGLADDRPEGRASGTEWRTAPLWGIGLTEQVTGHAQFLHDGRARNLLEAVLWHGGEAQAARDEVVGLSKTDRDALIAFLGSL